MPDRRTSEGCYLEAGVEKLRPLLSSHGFEFAWGDEAIGHLPFATAFFRRGKLEISLIVRSRDQLGCPNYSEGKGYAGHADMFWALGRTGEARLIPNDFLSYKAEDDGDPFVAFFADLDQVILPALEHSLKNFSAAVARAHKKFQDQLRGKTV